MKWSIHQLSKYRKDGLILNTDLQLETIKKRNQDIRAISPVHVEGRCTFGPSQLTCQFTLSATLTLPCSRTWEDVSYPVQVDAVEVFSWIDEEHRGDEGSDIHYIDGEVIDMAPVLEELILLEIPMQVFLEDSEGQVQNGANWSYTTDEQLVQQEKRDEQKGDPRLAALANFFDQKDE